MLNFLKRLFDREEPLQSTIGAEAVAELQQMKRIAFDFDVGNLKYFDDLKTKAGLAERKDLLNEAISFFEYCLDYTAKTGNLPLVVKEDGSVQELSGGPFSKVQKEWFEMMKETSLLILEVGKKYRDGNGESWTITREEEGVFYDENENSYSILGLCLPRHSQTSEKGNLVEEV